MHTCTAPCNAYGRVELWHYRVITETNWTRYGLDKNVMHKRCRKMLEKLLVKGIRSAATTSPASSRHFAGKPLALGG
jgi:hypothetical protein